MHRSLLWRLYAQVWWVCLLLTATLILSACGGEGASIVPVATGGSAGSAGAAGVAGQDAAPAPEASAESSSDTATEPGPTSQAATPVFGLPPGTYESTQSLELSCATPKATIRFTTDGTTPSHDSAVFVTAILLPAGSTTTVQAFAEAEGFLDSAVATGQYVIKTNPPQQLHAPLFSPPGGTYTAPQNVVITSPDTGAEIHYTSDGTVPSAASTLYSAPIPVSFATTLQAIAVDPTQMREDSSVSAATYVFSPGPKAALPVFSLPTGQYPLPVTVSITCATPNSQLWYTLDNTDPSPGGLLYSAPLVLSVDSWVKALCTASGYLDSDIAAAYYAGDGTLPKAATPQASPPGGVYCSPPTVSLSTTTPNAEIRYTLDGTDPLPTSPLYSGPIDIVSSLVLKAQTVAPNFSPSNLATLLYTLSGPCPASSPTISPGPSGGTFCAPVEVTLTTTEPSGTILYTLDGTLPSAGNGFVYGAPFTLWATATVTAITTALAKANSPPSVSQFNLTNCALVASPVVLSPDAISSYNDIVVTMTTTTVGAAICYTTDGSNPTCGANGDCSTGLTYGGIPVTVAQDGTKVTAIACEFGYSPSPVTSATYHLSTAPVEFSLPPGQVASGTLLTLSSLTNGSQIRFRTDGVDPTCAIGTEYASPITLTQSTAFQAIACKAGYATAPAVSVAYTVP